jgi:hypothetical protein
VWRWSYLWFKSTQEPPQVALFWELLFGALYERIMDDSDSNFEKEGADGVSLTSLAAGAAEKLPCVDEKLADVVLGAISRLPPPKKAPTEKHAHAHSR